MARQKYILVYKDSANDSIRKETIKVRTLSRNGLQLLLDNCEDLVCVYNITLGYFPLDYLKKKTIIKPLLYIKNLV
jgi:hypothetical protein